MLTVLRCPAERIPASQCILATARSCLALLIERYKPKAVWLPGLVPEGLLNPFKRADVPIRFYPLLDDLSPDYGRLSNWVNKSKHRKIVIVVVHYCGYRMPTLPAFDLARARDGILLEDCAQALIGPASRGDWADVAVYSINKFMPMFGAGIMLSCNDEIDLNVLPNEEVETGSGTRLYASSRF